MNGSCTHSPVPRLRQGEGPANQNPVIRSFDVIGDVEPGATVTLRIATDAPEVYVDVDTGERLEEEFLYTWYTSGGVWTNRKLITIDHARVSGSAGLSDFPLLFSVTDANLRYTANGGSAGKVDGSDILFTAADGDGLLRRLPGHRREERPDASRGALTMASARGDRPPRGPAGSPSATSLLPS